MKKIKLGNYPVGPFPVVIAGVEVNGRPNYVTVGACGVVCMKPVLYISLKSTHYSTRGVKETGCFSVNIPSADMVGNTDYCGIVSGKETDKSQVFTSFYDSLGKAPMIGECPLNFLCRVIQSVPILGFEMFLGEIVSAYSNDNCLSDSKPDPLKINPLVISGNNYYALGRVIGAIYEEGAKYKEPIQ